VQADKHRSERSFEVGDSVYLKLQPYVQTSIATRANHKLSFRYFGPYPVVAKVGQVAYKLLLPEHISVHPVFHVSQLKKALPPTVQVSSDIPKHSDTDAFRIPTRVLQRRLKPDGDKLVAEVLVQWSSWSPSMATWELEVELKDQFPAAPAWGQAGIQERGNVRKLIRKAAANADEQQEQARQKESIEDEEDGPEARRPKRTAKPNPNYFGPE
jgi:excinuclease UvrABC nuclease subunit